MFLWQYLYQFAAQWNVFISGNQMLKGSELHSLGNLLDTLISVGCVVRSKQEERLTRENFARMAEEERLAKVQAVRKDAEERMAREKARAEEFDRIKQEAERKAKEERLWNLSALLNSRKIHMLWLRNQFSVIATLKFLVFSCPFIRLALVWFAISWVLLGSQLGHVETINTDGPLHVFAYLFIYICYIYL